MSVQQYIDQAKAALAQDIDYIAVGAIFPSPTKPQVHHAGLSLLEQVKDLSHLPIIAIGGLTPKNANQAITSGATGLALCQSIIASDQPYKTTQTLKQIL